MASLNDEGALRSKRNAYEEIYALDLLDDSSDEELRQSLAILKRKRDDINTTGDKETTGASERRHKSRKLDSDPSTLMRTTSAPTWTKVSSQTATNKRIRRAATVNGGAMIPASAKSRVPTSSGPNAGQMFSGFYFYFFPNNDSNPARKARIRKAVDCGAVWERDYTEAVTHVIVDRDLNYGQLKKYLRLDDVPARVHVVGEVYTAHCYEYRCVVNPRQECYKVKGYNSRLQVLAPPSKATSSLQLKPAKRDVQAREAQTPSQRTVESTASEKSPVKSTPIPDNLERPPAIVNAVSSEGQDALDVAIVEVLKMQELMFDEDEVEDEDGNGSTGQPDFQIDPELLDIPKWQKDFQCMQSNTEDNSGCANGHTVGVLQKMADYHAVLQDQWRPMAYRRAIGTLRKHPSKVMTAEEARKLPCIGDSIASKIEEIVRTGFLQRLQNAQADPLDIALATFLKVYGIGFATGMALIQSGFRTLEDLRTKANLTAIQKIGLEHYDDFNMRIPRAEVKAHSLVVCKAAIQLHPDIKVFTMGSYRRGAQTSGDIDLIITHPTWPLSRLRAMLMDTLVPKLFKQDFLKCSLAQTSRLEGSKWHGASCLPGTTVWRRIDFLLVPDTQLGAALLYFTGNDIFNRSMRLLAGRKGMRLNQRGLYKDVLRGKGGVKLTEGELVEGRDERKIFAAMGVPWRDPQARLP